MGRPKTPQSATKKAPSKQRHLRPRTGKFRPLPPKGDIRSLAKYRLLFSEKLLANRIRKLSKQERAQFAKLCKVTPRHVRSMAPTGTRVQHPLRNRQAAQNLWSVMIGADQHNATHTELQSKLKDNHNIIVPLSTVARWVKHISKPRAQRTSTLTDQI